MYRIEALLMPARFTETHDVQKGFLHASRDAVQVLRRLLRSEHALGHSGVEAADPQRARDTTSIRPKLRSIGGTGRTIARLHDVSPTKLKSIGIRHGTPAESGN